MAARGGGAERSVLNARSPSRSRSMPWRRSCTTRDSLQRPSKSCRATCPKSPSSIPSKKSPGPKAFSPALTASSWRRGSGAAWSCRRMARSSIGTARASCPRHASGRGFRRRAGRPRARPASSGSPQRSSEGGLLLDREQFDLEDQRRAALDLRGASRVAVGELRRAHETGLAARLHELETLRPARNDAAQRERHGLAAVDGAVEDGSVPERAAVVDLDLVGRLRRSACSGLDLFVEEPGWLLDGATLRGFLRDEGRTGLLLAGGRRAEAALRELLQLRAVRLEVHLRGTAEDAVGEALLHGGQLRGRQLERPEVLAHHEADRVERPGALSRGNHPGDLGGAGLRRSRFRGGGLRRFLGERRERRRQKKNGGDEISPHGLRSSLFV